jgi:hypothetical protein
MSSRDLHYRNSPFGHLVFLVSEALRGPARKQPAAPVSPAGDPWPRRRSWLDRIDQWFWQQRLNDREAYLAGAKDIAEMEARLRDLDRSRYY